MTVEAQFGRGPAGTAGKAGTAGTAGAGTAAPETAEHTVHSPSLSPDGRHVAYVSDRGGAPRAWVQPVGSDLTFLVDTGPHPVGSVAWSPDGSWLACVLAPGGAPRTEVWLVRPDGSDLRQAAGFGADTACLPGWLPSGGLAITENTEGRVRALLVDPVTGCRRTLAEGNLMALIDVAPDGGRVLLRRGPRGARHIAVRDLTTGEEHPLVPGDAACFAPDGETVYARTDLGGELAVLARISGGSPTIVAGRADAELESFAMTADGATAALVWNVYGGASELTILGLVTGVERPVPPPAGATVVGSGVFAAGGGTLAFIAEGPGRPASVHTLDLRSWTVTPAIGGQSVQDRGVRPELRVLTAADGLAISGWLYRPAGPGPYPTVLSLHSGPESQERPGHHPLFQALVGRGIAVFAPNVRGSSGFGRSFVNADNGAGRYGAVADVAACVAHLVDTGIAEAGRIGCMGRSYGGYLTLAALVTYPELFAAGVDVCGMANFATFYAGTEPWIAAAAVGKYGDPVRDRELLRDLSPITHADRLVAPLLVVHGARDTNVPVCEAEQVVAALRAGGVPHRFLLFADEGHDFVNRANREAYVEATVDWLTRYLSRPVAGAGLAHSSTLIDLVPSGAAQMGIRLTNAYADRRDPAWTKLPARRRRPSPIRSSGIAP
jgi:dipeptidyl aminopeptidase/acylaminoacyl peptidase